MNGNKLMHDYDCKNDSLFIYCTENYEYEVSLELDNETILDLDSDGKPVAFEFLNASKVFKSDKCHFKNLAGITVQTDITEEEICLKVQLMVLMDNDTHVFEFNRIATNLTNVPAIGTVLVTA